MNPVVYNIPVQSFDAYRDRQVIVRAKEPSELAERLNQSDLKNVVYVQLLSPSVDVEPLTHWGDSVPIDIVVRDPVQDFPLLYNFAKLLDKHPVRVSVFTSPGFSKAVILALALNFAVKLEVGQPDDAVIGELQEVLDRYLHRPNVSRPVEFFHSIFQSFYTRESSSLWFVQEEDPEQFRFVADDGGMETISSRFGGIALHTNGGLHNAPAGSASECDTCEFLDLCGGYFKWPDKEFSCAGVKSLFATMSGAAQDLRIDMERFESSQGGLQP
jgi:hypothetical protein